MTHLMPRGKLCGRADGHDGRHRSAEALKRHRERRPQYAGVSAHPLYGTWVLMIHRCENPNHRAYRWYGAIGIKVCDRWHDARLFFEDIERDLGPRPDGLTLDRISVGGDYEPGKVRWATKSEQSCNQWDFDAGRVRTVVMRFGSGETRASIARALDLDYVVVSRIVLRWRKGGYQALRSTS